MAWLRPRSQEFVNGDLIPFNVTLHIPPRCAAVFYSVAIEVHIFQKLDKIWRCLFFVCLFGWFLPIFLVVQACSKRKLLWQELWHQT